MENKKLLNVTVAGPDRPGVLASLTEILVKHDVEILDTKQASLDRLLGLHLLLDLSQAKESEDSVVKDLLYQAKQLNLTLDQDTSRLIQEPEIITRGFIYTRGDDDLLEETCNLVKRAIENGDDAQGKDLQQTIKTFLYNKTKRRPMVFVTLSKA